MSLSKSKAVCYIFISSEHEKIHNPFEVSKASASSKGSINNFRLYASEEMDMNLSINGQSQIPPGFRFHPTEEELLHYYLRKKMSHKKIDLDVIREVDLNKLEPWDIQGTTATSHLILFPLRSLSL